MPTARDSLRDAGGAVLSASAKPPISPVSGIEGIQPQDRRRKAEMLS